MKVRSRIRKALSRGGHRLLQHLDRRIDKPVTPLEPEPREPSVPVRASYDWSLELVPVPPPEPPPPVPQGDQPYEDGVADWPDPPLPPTEEDLGLGLDTAINDAASLLAEFEDDDE